MTDVPKVTQLMCGRARIQARPVGTKAPMMTTEIMGMLMCHYKNGGGGAMVFTDLARKWLSPCKPGYPPTGQVNNTGEW